MSRPWLQLRMAASIGSGQARIRRKPDPRTAISSVLGRNGASRASLRGSERPLSRLVCDRFGSICDGRAKDADRPTSVVRGSHRISPVADVPLMSRYCSGDSTGYP